MICQNKADVGCFSETCQIVHYHVMLEKKFIFVVCLYEYLYLFCIAVTSSGESTACGVCEDIS